MTSKRVKLRKCVIEYTNHSFFVLESNVGGKLLLMSTSNLSTGILKWLVSRGIFLLLYRYSYLYKERRVLYENEEKLSDTIQNNSYDEHTYIRIIYTIIMVSTLSIPRISKRLRFNVAIGGLFFSYLILCGITSVNVEIQIWTHKYLRFCVHNNGLNT